MFIDNTYLNRPANIPANPAWVKWVEACKKLDPPPIYCEFPDGLIPRPLNNSGTTITYTYTIAASAVGSNVIGTTTTT